MQEAVKHLRDGLIGNVYMSRGLVFKWRPDIGNKATEPVPEGMNYDIWTGPAEMRDFSRNYVPYNWHWSWNYGNGGRWQPGYPRNGPLYVGAECGSSRKDHINGCKFLWDDYKETPEVLTSVYHYPKEKKVIQFEVRPWITNMEDGVGIGKYLLRK